MIPSLIKGDLIVLKSTNNPGFVCGQGKFAYFNKMTEKGDYQCSLHINGKDYIIIKQHQINSIFDVVTNIKKYQHDHSDGL